MYPQALDTCPCTFLASIGSILENLWGRSLASHRDSKLHIYKKNDLDVSRLNRYESPPHHERSWKNTVQKPSYEYFNTSSSTQCASVKSRSWLRMPLSPSARMIRQLREVVGMSCSNDFTKDSRFCSGGDGIRKLRRDEMGWVVVVVVHTINLSVYEAETGGSQSLRPP